MNGSAGCRRSTRAIRRPRRRRWWSGSRRWRSTIRSTATAVSRRCWRSGAAGCRRSPSQKILNDNGLGTRVDRWLACRLAFKPDGRRLTVVGDDSQAIYSFRAAEVRNILVFPGKPTENAFAESLQGRDHHAATVANSCAAGSNSRSDLYPTERNLLIRGVDREPFLEICKARVSDCWSGAKPSAVWEELGHLGEKIGRHATGFGVATAICESSPRYPKRTCDLVSNYIAIENRSNLLNSKKL